MVNIQNIQNAWRGEGNKRKTVEEDEDGMQMSCLKTQKSPSIDFARDELHRDKTASVVRVDGVTLVDIYPTGTKDLDPFLQRILPANSLVHTLSVNVLDLFQVGALYFLGSSAAPVTTSHAESQNARLSSSSSCAIPGSFLTT